MEKEPIIHSHITDCLPDNHPFQLSEQDGVWCDICGVLLHDCSVNECMQTWLETDEGNFCTKCFPIKEVIPVPYFWISETYNRGKF